MATPNIDKLVAARDNVNLTNRFINTVLEDAKWYFDKFGVDLLTDPDTNSEIANINTLMGQANSNIGGVKQKVANDTKTKTG